MSNNLLKRTFFLSAIASCFAFGSYGQTLCSTATLHGSYGLQITGTRPAPSVLTGVQGTPGMTELVSGVVIQIFDGAGGFSQTDSVKGSLSGITVGRAGNGTCSVNPDCTGTFTVNNVGAPPLVNQLVLTDNGQAFMTVVSSPQAIQVTSVGRKMSYLAGCSTNTPPIITAVTDVNGAPSASSKGVVIIYGQGFTSSGGNTLVLKKTGVADFVLSETAGAYYWDYSNSQINASLNGLAPGNWSLTVLNACSATASNSISLIVQ